MRSKIFSINVAVMYVLLVKCANKLIISSFLKIDVDLKLKKTFNTHH
jgi:hypothetical protein